jgi:S1-C subfamily serine protease
MKHSFLLVIFAILVALLSPVRAQDTAEILKAVILVRSTIPEDARTARYLGTMRQSNGVVIDSNGLILTIGYAIAEAETIEVIDSDGKVVSATFVGYDIDSGFGLIRANKPLEVTPMKPGNSSEIKVGDLLLLASYAGPGEVQGARVIARQEFVGYWEYLLEDAIFTSPPYADFGGAALVDRDGRLVGIGSLFTQVSVPGSGYVPCNMFVPIDRLKPILGDLLATGRSSGPQKPWLGIQAEETHGRVSVIRVSSGGPAEQAGVQPGDLILAVNDKAISGLADFYRKVWALGGAGVDVHLSIRRGAQVRKITVHSADRYEFLRMPPRTLMWTSHGTNEIGSLTMSSPGMESEGSPWSPIIIPIEPGLPSGFLPGYE